MAGCSAYVLSSRQEAFPVVILEAMAAGKAVISTNVGGVPEVIADGMNGLLVPVGDINALAEAMVRVTTNPTLAARLADAAGKSIGRYDWERISQEYVEAYKVTTEMKCCTRGIDL
jgi:2-deoxystreptamine N-acetyl-D-glucosaminyltransferase/2-deoxystreptamine glucosyltransferase